MNKEIFLTSYPGNGEGEPFSSQNHFLERFKSSLLQCKNALFVASNPDSFEVTDYYANETWYTMELSDIHISGHSVLDNRNSEQAEQLVSWSDVIILAGGHVPTQNRFFQKIGLRELLIGFEGVILGISAGSMNSADIVYAQPEEEGEGINPEYVKFLKGLGLTQCMILPHYQDTKNQILDGKRIFEEITYPDSMGREFYALPDGSYLYIKDGQERICGEAYLIKDGFCKQICSNEEEFIL